MYHYYKVKLSPDQILKLKFEFLGWGSLVCSLSSTTVLYSAAKFDQEKSEPSVQLQIPATNMHCYQPVSILQKVSRQSPVSLETVQHGMKPSLRSNNVCFRAEKLEDKKSLQSKKTSSGGSNLDTQLAISSYLLASPCPPKTVQAISNSNHSTQKEFKGKQRQFTGKNKESHERFYNKPVRGLYRTSSGSIRYYL